VAVIASEVFILVDDEYDAVYLKAKQGGTHLHKIPLLKAV
jgi:hypothetical protein